MGDIVVVEVDFFRPRRAGCGEVETVWSPLIDARGVRIVDKERKQAVDRKGGGEGRI